MSKYWTVKDFPRVDPALLAAYSLALTTLSVHISALFFYVASIRVYIFIYFEYICIAAYIFEDISTWYMDFYKISMISYTVSLISNMFALIVYTF